MFCPNSSFSNLWVEKWMSECHFKCTEAFAFTTLLTICGYIQIYFYKEYSVRLPPEMIPNSKLFFIQIGLTVLIPLLDVLKLFFDFFYIQMGVIYGYQVCKYLKINKCIVNVFKYVKIHCLMCLSFNLI